MKKLYIRADGNEILGLGHMMRCMSIAEAYTDMGGECEFLVADAKSAKIAAERGFKATVLFGKWDDLQYELQNIKRVIELLKVELLLVDSYYANENYFKELHGRTKLIYLTGKSDTCYCVDALINYTIGSDKAGYESLYQNTDTRLLIGVSYAPLRKQFEEVCTSVKGVKDILLTTGGTDGMGIAVTLLDTIQKRKTKLWKCNWHIVVGKFYSDEVKERLNEYSSNYENIRLYENVSEMAELMKQCNLAVSAAGSTIYELCACGVPTIAFSFVDNQVKQLLEFAKEEYVYSAGDIRVGKQACADSMIRFLNMLISDCELRKHQSKKVRMLVDGKGAKRLAKVLQTL